MQKKALLMVHTADPKQAIWDNVSEHLNGIQVMGADVLLGIYVRPDKTAGGIILSDKTRGEDVYQGKVAMVLKLGPLAFQEDAANKFPVKPQVGDWVTVRVGDTFQLQIGDQPCRLADENDIRLVVERPDVIY